MMKDPICGMDVESEQFAFEIGGKKYFFCSLGCLEEFKKSSDEGSGRLDRYDLVIIGAGPAVLDAAIQAAILKINTLVIIKDISAEKFENQFLHEHYLKHIIGEVVKINRKGSIFEILTKEGSSITAYAIIIAIGMGQTEFCRNLVALNEKGDVIINPDFSTDVDGIFACSVVIGGEGAKACLSSKKYLQDMGIK